MTAVSRRRPSGGASSPDPCGGTWVGVTCNGEERVTAINASHGGLTGHLVGADLTRLASLSELDLSFNALRDDLPVLPQPFGGLRALDLCSNSFFAITDGFFAAFPALETFNLDDNKMSTLKPWIPYDMTSCPSLRSFSAVNIHFAGGFPNYLGNATLFSELESLSLARNLLWGEITVEFGKNSKTPVRRARNRRRSHLRLAVAATPPSAARPRAPRPQPLPVSVHRACSRPCSRLRSAVAANAAVRRPPHAPRRAPVHACREREIERKRGRERRLRGK
uniref:Leucine-rich repeat-containing N-terminal plant-type domain-containing protein n=1 Tax=Oryza meridionalis TaxID=40149 RepID=A0A0E0ENB8_9ORYZ